MFTTCFPPFAALACLEATAYHGLCFFGHYFVLSACVVIATLLADRPPRPSRRATNGAGQRANQPIMKIINLTPHDVVVFTSLPTTDDDKAVYAKSGFVARTIPKRQACTTTLANRVAIYEPQVAESVAIECGSDNVDADAIIVSTMVAEYLRGQTCDGFVLTTTLDGKRDVRIFAPDTGPDSVERDKATGAVRGVRRLCEYEPLLATSIDVKRRRV